MIIWIKARLHAHLLSISTHTQMKWILHGAWGMVEIAGQHIKYCSNTHDSTFMRTKISPNIKNSSKAQKTTNLNR